MATHSRLVSRTSDPLDVPLKQLTVRSLPSRGVTAPASDAIERVRGEFVEMRGFSPTLQQAARLFHLPQDECSHVLSVLLKEGFIRQTTDGRFRLITG
jgi:DNA-binding IclR family transcriptional regulator